MVKFFKPAAAAVATVALVVASVAVASASSSGTTAGDASALKDPSKGIPADAVQTWSSSGKAARAAVTAGPVTTNLEFVGLATGCRIFDTRNAGGVFAAFEFRDLSILDSAIDGQGGRLGGCGLPANAVAVDLSLSTAGGSPTNVGYVRVGPGGVAPTATVLQFLKSQGTSVTTTAALSTSDTMRLQVFGATTHLIGDVLGYWQTTAHGTILADGTLQAGGAGVTSIFKDITFAGDYWVTFDRPIANCSAVASIGEIPPTTRVIVAKDDTRTQVLFDVRDCITTDEIDGPVTFLLNC